MSDHMQSEVQYTPAAQQMNNTQQTDPNHNPGSGLGIAGFVCSFFSFFAFMGIVAFVLSLIGLLQSRKAGKSNGLAIAGIAISSLGLIIYLFWLLLLVIGFMMVPFSN